MFKHQAEVIKLLKGIMIMKFVSLYIIMIYDMIWKYAYIFSYNQVVN